MVSLASAGSGSSFSVAAAVAQRAFLTAVVRNAVVPELTKLGVDAPAIIKKRVRALFKRIRRLVAIGSILDYPEVMPRVR